MITGYFLLGQVQKDSVKQQPAAKDSFYNLSPVEVRAVRANEHAPVTKTNISKKEIGEQNLGQDLPFLLNQTPSVVINSDAGNGVGYTGIRIRGTDASRINVTLNGIPYNDAESQQTYFVDLPDIASSLSSIQIQRGVGSSSNGAGARLIALTNVDLDAAVKAGRFREDLFYRLNVINIRVPPLRERKEDLSQLVEYFLKLYSAKHGRNVQRPAAGARVLKAYDYPGNARELANIIERAVIVAMGKKLEEARLAGGIERGCERATAKGEAASLAEVEAAYITETLAATGGNKTECARILGISRKNLYEKIARYKLLTDRCGCGSSGQGRLVMQGCAR